MLGLIILATYLVITPLEVRLVGPTTRSRRANLVMILPVLLTAILGDVALVGITTFGHHHGVGLLPWTGLTGIPALLTTIVALDFVGYAWHRWCHLSRAFWNVHRTHHTDPDMDITTALRSHPLDVAGIVVSSAVGVVILGASPAHVAISGSLGALFGLWDHTRLVLPARLEKRLVWFIQTPGMHRVHHSPTLPETNTNYGLILTVWDRLLGSYSPPEPRHITGLDTTDLATRQSVRAMLSEPRRPLVKTSSAEMRSTHAVAS